VRTWISVLPNPVFAGWLSATTQGFGRKDFSGTDQARSGSLCPARGIRGAREVLAGVVLLLAGVIPGRYLLREGAV